MNDWTQTDPTHWETTDAILMHSPHKLMVINAAEQATGFVAILPDKPNICIYFWQMEPIYDEHYRLIGNRFTYQGITYTIHKEAASHDQRRTARAR